MKTAHIDLKVNAAGQPITGSGDERSNEGMLAGLNITESLPGGAGSLQLIIVDGKTYAKLPPRSNPCGKPYLLVTSTAANPSIKQLAVSLDTAQGVGLHRQRRPPSSPPPSRSERRAARTSTASRRPTTRSSSTSTKLPATTRARTRWCQRGLTKLPIELYVDTQGRPVQVTENFKVPGAGSLDEGRLSKYDQPVTITAPPADQVEHPLSP